MNISFRDRKLKDLANDDRKAVKVLGKIMAEKYRLRLYHLHKVATLEDIRNLPGRYHELTGNRKGQWACDLNQPYRLIFEPDEKPIPTDLDGKYLWVAIRSVEVIDIENYHKEK